MGKVAYYGNWDGRVDRSAGGEKARRALRPEDGEEACWTTMMNLRSPLHGPHAM
jgi:hypothetical protein